MRVLLPAAIDASVNVGWRFVSHECISLLKTADDRSHSSVSVREGVKLWRLHSKQVLAAADEKQAMALMVQRADTSLVAPE